MEFRNTPITGLDESPAQLLMGRHIRSALPMTGTLLQPFVSEGTREKLEQRQQWQKHAYDGRTPLSILQPDDVVRYQAGKVWKPAVIINKH